MIDDLFNPKIVFDFKSQLYTQAGLEPVPFQENYISIRQAENRIHSIDFIKKLPEVPNGTPHYHEWSIRRRSSRNLLHYLNTRKNVETILEIGCGNGWLTNLVATSSDSRVVGLDVNLVELKQAAEAFGTSPRTHFVFGNILDDIFARNSFDVVLLAASIQYFNNLQELFSHILPLLKINGEVHILDSPFYTEDQIPEARKRSHQYFSKLGHAEMGAHYYHHSVDNLREFNTKILHEPGTLKNRILRKWFMKDLSPFPWIIVRTNKI